MKVFGVKDITYNIADVDQKEVITKAILEKLAQDGIEFEGEGYFDINITVTPEKWSGY